MKNRMTQHAYLRGLRNLRVYFLGILDERREAAMKDAVGYLLRETWKEKGNQVCFHPELSREYSFAGVITGAHICTTCGSVMQSESIQQGSDKTVMD